LFSEIDAPPPWWEATRGAPAAHPAPRDPARALALLASLAEEGVGR
jgi:hypothetical protein